MMDIGQKKCHYQNNLLNLLLFLIHLQLKNSDNYYKYFSIFIFYAKYIPKGIYSLSDRYLFDNTINFLLKIS